MANDEIDSLKTELENAPVASMMEIENKKLVGFAENVKVKLEAAVDWKRSLKRLLFYSPISSFHKAGLSLMN